MNKKLELELKLKALDEQISKFKEEYAAESYFAFLGANGCVMCDGSGMMASLGITVRCVVCDGKTVAHACTFYKLSNDIYTVDYEKESRYRNVYGCSPVYENRNYFYTNAAEARRQKLLSQREEVFKELCSFPSDNDKFASGDIVGYKGGRYTVVFSNDSGVGIKLEGSKSKDPRVGLITVNADELNLISSLDDKMPLLVGVSIAQRNYGYACRRAAINQGLAGADLCIKETNAKFWIEKFKGICPPRS
jgi:hypothetical protein